MYKKEIASAFIDVLKDIVKDAHANAHVFDANAEKCKTCKDFNLCKEFKSMLDAVKASDLNDEDKKDIIAFIIFFKGEAEFVNEFKLEDIDCEETPIEAIHRRFENIVKNFKNFPALVDILSESQLSYLRKIVGNVREKCQEVIDKIEDDNMKDYNTLMALMRKPQQEAKRYEDMTREELLEELKKK